MQTTEDQTYEGWKNHATWATNLWLSNDEGLYNAVQEMARQAHEDAPADSNVAEGIWSVENTAKFRLADTIKDFISEEVVTYDEADLTADLLGYALGCVDWEEIAASWLSDLS